MEPCSRFLISFPATSPSRTTYPTDRGLIIASVLVGTASDSGSRGEIPAGSLLLGFGHLEMLAGLYQLSHRVR